MKKSVMKRISEEEMNEKYRGKKVCDTHEMKGLVRLI